jgi:hypothetical protein
MLKSYRPFVIIFSVLLVLYIVVEYNKPKPIDWTVTLSKDDKNPFGAYVLFNELQQLFPNAAVNAFREPPYNVLADTAQKNNAYILLAPELTLQKTDIKRLLKFAENGNAVFVSAYDCELLMDTLGLKTKTGFDLKNKDSAKINFVNPLLKAPHDYSFKKLSINEYFSEIKRKDSTIILGSTQKGDPNFVKVVYGEGAFYIAAAPLCFSNYFMLFKDNQKYISNAFSYLPVDVENIYWDEYYKTGREGAQTPLRFLLSNLYLRWALRIVLILLIVFVLFDMKRRQRIIPIVEPLRNTSLDFVKTVSSVYYHQHDNKSIAEKKLQYWLDSIRSRYYLSSAMDEDFIKQLNKKSGASVELIKTIISYFDLVKESKIISDQSLLQLNKNIDTFYKISQQ